MIGAARSPGGSVAAVVPELPHHSADVNRDDGAASSGLILSERYRLDQRLAIGGMAEVWEGTDLLLERKVAVKVLHRHLQADPAFVERFRREALAVARLHHPGIVGVYDTSSDADLEAIILELVRGPTLRHHLDASGPLSPLETVEIGISLSGALVVAHAAGLVHRDIKPANVLLGDERTMLTDFGIAKALDASEHTATGTMLGSAGYLAPEQVDGRAVDARSDLFSLGVVLYECATAQRPWDADNAAAVALARLREPPPALRSVDSSVPAELEEIVLWCLAREPEERPQNATDLREALGQARRALGGGNRPADAMAAPVARRGPDAPRPRDDADATTVGRAHHSPATGATSVGRAPSQPVPPTEPDRPASRRRWIAPTAMLLVLAVAVGVAALLIVDTDPGREVLGRVDNELAGTSAEISDVVPFDPEGSGEPGENDDLAPNAWDGDPSTQWQTVGYDERTFGIKRGVGLVVELGEPAELRRLRASSPTQGWAAAAYVAEEPGEVLEDWGEPVDEQRGIAGDVELDLGGEQGRFVLLWITDLGDGPPRHRTEISDLAVES